MVYGGEGESSSELKDFSRSKSGEILQFSGSKTDPNWLKNGKSRNRCANAPNDYYSIKKQNHSNLICLGKISENFDGI